MGWVQFSEVTVTVRLVGYCAAIRGGNPGVGIVGKLVNPAEAPAGVLAKVQV